MITQTKATIYLSDRRGCTQEDWFRSYHTFNSGIYYETSRGPFGNLAEFNDDTLKEGRTIVKYSPENSLIIVIPIVGTVNYSSGENTGAAEPGNVVILPVLQGNTVALTNPYKEELINFLHLRFSMTLYQPAIASVMEFDLEEQTGKLIPFIDQEENGYTVSASIGKFKGREEGVLIVPDENIAGIFVFVVEGAFEVQNRLLHARDGLALWHTPEVEFEALSNDAILLLLQVKLV
ncbi:MAG TPA: pirin [Ohtaekwangia sp.]|uniref:pirin family protein n=1 Tax=Ohtaekwangia sp. TaxID=2066019 RepID=UPI002F92CA2F